MTVPRAPMQISSRPSVVALVVASIVAGRSAWATCATEWLPDSPTRDYTLVSFEVLEQEDATVVPDADAAAAGWLSSFSQPTGSLNVPGAAVELAAHSAGTLTLTDAGGGR